ncbi:MAG: hypothetical protein U5J82_06185 [Desulfobacterales bacterium]|nr:hypothetical protein [Desulfobacterales bacterium]
MKPNATGNLMTYTDQQWDLEGMFWNAGSKTLSIVGGFDYLNGVAGESAGDLFIGDRCVLDFQQIGLNLSQSSGAFDVIFSELPLTDMGPLALMV